MTTTTADTTADPDADYRSRCPLASALDLLGDKWTLIIVRDMIAGKRRYGEFLSSPERIPSNILAGRLRRLDDAGIVDKRLYQEKPTAPRVLADSQGGGALAGPAAARRLGPPASSRPVGATSVVFRGHAGRPLRRRDAARVKRRTACTPTIGAPCAGG